MISPLNIDITSDQYDITSHWLPIATTLTKMDPSQSQLLIKLPISIEHNSLRYDTSVLIGSAATLIFSSPKVLNRNGLVGSCKRCPKFVVRKGNGEHRSATVLYSLTRFYASQKAFFPQNPCTPASQTTRFLCWVTNYENVECFYSTF